MKNRLLLILFTSFFGTALIPAAGEWRKIRPYAGPGYPSTQKAAWEHVKKTRNGVASSPDEIEAFGILYRLYHGPLPLKEHFKEYLLDDYLRPHDLSLEQNNELSVALDKK